MQNKKKVCTNYVFSRFHRFSYRFQSILSETQRQYRMQQKQLMEYAQSLKQREYLIAKLQKQIITP